MPKDALRIFNMSEDAIRDKLCTEVPTLVSENSVFVLDSNSLRDPGDAKCDGMGSWRDNGPDRIPLGMLNNKWRRRRPKKVVTEYCLRIVRYGLTKRPSVRKFIYFISRNDKVPISGRMIIVYRFLKTGSDSENEDGSPGPHRNSKRNDRPHTKKKPSAVRRLQDNLVGMGNREAVAATNRDSGGFMMSSSQADLVDDRTASYLRSKVRQPRVGTSENEIDDLIRERDNLEDVLCSLSLFPNFTAVLANDQLMKELIRCCTDSESYGPVVLDPSFNFGRFSVTPLTFTHQILESRAYARPAHFMAAILVHYNRSEEDFTKMLTNLACHYPDLRRVLAFGTDGERGLSNAFSRIAPNAVHLRCFRHFAENIRRALQPYVSPAKQQRVVLEIFGYQPSPIQGESVWSSDTPNEECLLSAGSAEDFEDRFERLIAHYSGEPRVQDFLTERKAILKDNMSALVRTKAGLGSPPIPFTTNAAETSNSKLRRWAQRKESSLPDFCKVAQNMFQSDMEEIGAAYGNVSNLYVAKLFHLPFLKKRLRGRYFFRLSPYERGRFLKEVTTPSMAQMNLACRTGETKVSGNLTGTSVPPLALQQIRNDASNLLTYSDATIQRAPSIENNGQVFSVRATAAGPISNDRRQNEEVKVDFVTHEVRCSCRLYRLHSMCCHAVAVAELTSFLEPYLAWHRENVVASVQRSYDMQSDALRRGRKGNKPRRRQPVKKR